MVLLCRTGGGSVFPQAVAVTFEADDIGVMHDPIDHGQSDGLRQLKTTILAYLDHNCAPKGPTQAINGVIETTLRIVHTFRNFTYDKLRYLVGTQVTAPTELNRLPMLKHKGPQ